MEILDKIKYIKKNRLLPYELKLYDLMCDMYVVENQFNDGNIFYRIPNIGDYFIKYEPDTNLLKINNSVIEGIKLSYDVDYDDIMNSVKKIYKQLYKIDTKPIRCVFY